MQLGDRLEDVAGDHGDVLDAGAAVVVEILLDLRLLACPVAGSLMGNLILPLPPSITFDIERGILGGDGFVSEVDDLLEPQHILVELDPLVHLAKLDVADDMVNRGEASLARPRGVSASMAAKAWQERPGVVLALDEGVQRLAVGVDAGALDVAMLIVVCTTGSMALCAPRSQASAIGRARRRGTSSAITLTPSPCARQCCAIGESGRRGQT